MISAHPYIVLSDEKPVVEYNPDESLVFLSVAVDAYPSSWTMQWFKDGVLIASDDTRLIAKYVLTLLDHCVGDPVLTSSLLLSVGMAYLLWL